MPLANARHILVKTKDEAENLKKQLAGGAEAPNCQHHSPGHAS